MTATSALIGLLSAYVVTDGEPPADTGQPHAIVYGGTERPADLRLSHEHKRTVHDWQIVCVSNNPAGARMLAEAVTRAVDGASYDAANRWQVTYASPPIEDRDDPSRWRWSSTVEVTLTIGR